MLRVNHDGLAAAQLGERNAMGVAAEAQVDAVMRKTFAPHALAHPGVFEQLDRPVLQDAGANGGFDVLAAAPLDPPRRDSLQMQEMRKEKPRRSSADDSDLRTHGWLQYLQGRAGAGFRQLRLRDRRGGQRGLPSRQPPFARPEHARAAARSR